jgi:hypothetical protein
VIRPFLNIFLEYAIITIDKDIFRISNFKKPDMSDSRKGLYDEDYVFV